MRKEVKQTVFWRDTLNVNKTFVCITCKTNFTVQLKIHVLYCLSLTWFVVFMHLHSADGNAPHLSFILYMSENLSEICLTVVCKCSHPIGSFVVCRCLRI